MAHGGLLGPFGSGAEVVAGGQRCLLCLYWTENIEALNPTLGLNPTGVYPTDSALSPALHV